MIDVLGKNYSLNIVCQITNTKELDKTSTKPSWVGALGKKIFFLSPFESSK